MTKSQKQESQSVWKKSNNEMGYTPTFDIKCYFCGSEMFPRLSLMEVEGKGDSIHSVTLAFKIAYKCAKCAWLVTFQITTENEYWTKTLLLRGNRMLYYPPLEVWNEEKSIRRQLEGLGYFGGREV